MSKNLFDIFETNVKKTPNKIAIILKDTKLTYKELYQNIKTLSYHFNKIGINKNTHVAIFENNSIEFVTILLSCAYLGSVLVPFPFTLKGKQQEKALQKSDCEYIIGWHSVIKQLNENSIYPPAKLISLGKKIENCFFYNDFSNKNFDFFIDYEVPKETNYILTMTSGSTGDPKPIVFSQETKINRSILATKDIYNLNNDDIVLTSTPLYHSLAQRSVLLPLLIGGTSVLLSKFTPTSWLETIEKYKVTFLFAVSTQLELISNNFTNGSYDLSSLKTIISSSAILKEPTKKALLEIFTCNVYECYGTSEVGVITNLLIKEKLGSVGKALPFVKLKIVNGEIACKSLTEFKGYYKNKEATKNAYDKDGYFYTGDIGYLSDDGYLFYKDRLKDIIITGAINVYPKDIENVINEFKEVDECAVLGIEDKYFGEIIVAFMTQKENYTIDIKAIKKSCLENLIDYQIPQRFEIIKEFPKSGLGKILKHKLGEQYR
jgi:long-chain acyl-CoA synthetase